MSLKEGREEGHERASGGEGGINVLRVVSSQKLKK